MTLHDKLKFWLALNRYIEMIIGPAISPLSLPDAIVDGLSYVKAYGGTEQRILPVGYTRLEYIESSGTQYIDTGLKMTQDDEIDVEWCYHISSNVTSSGRMFGARYTTPKYGVVVGSENGKAVSTTNIFGGFYDTNIAGPDISIGSWIAIKLSANGFFVDNTQYGTAYAVSDFETPFTIKLFAFEQATDSSTTPSIGCGIGRCRRLKIYKSGILAQDLVPAKNSLNIVGMYDTVSDTFLENQGTGDFVAGPEVSSIIPAGYTLLEYIEGDGTQYIDTGYFFDSITTETVTIDFMRTNTGGAGSMIYGFRNAYKDNGYGIQFKDDGKTYMQYGNLDNGLGSQYAGSLNTRYTLTQTGPTYNFNGGSYTSTATTPTQSYSLYIFCLNNGGTPSVSKTSMRLYGFTIKDANGVKKMNLIPAKNNSGNIGMYDLVSGQFFTNQGTGSFTAGKETMPTPDNPMPLICNNGKIKYGLHGKNLSVTSGTPLRCYMGTQSSNPKVYFAYYEDASFTLRIPVMPNTQYKLYWDTTDSSVVGTIFRVGAIITDNIPVSGSSVASYEANGTTIGAIVPRTGGTPQDTSEVSFITGNNVKYIYIQIGGSNIYWNNDDPSEINARLSHLYIQSKQVYTEDTVETLLVHGKNLFNPVNVHSGSIDAQGQVQTYSTLEYTDLIPVIPNRTYVWSGVNNSTNTANKRLHGYDRNGVWVAQLAVEVGDGNYQVSTTIPSNVAYVALSGIRTDIPDTNVQLELGSTATTYEPFYDGGTAVCENLFAIGEHVDTQEILMGQITKKVGVKAFDGTENWTSSTYDGKTVFTISKTSIGTDSNVLPAASNKIMCSHYPIGTSSSSYGYLWVGSTGLNWYSDTTLQNWTDWLATQYAAGTPMMIVYPLATNMIESVAPQVLQTQKGDNTITITQSSMDNLKIEAKYKKNI